MEVKITNNSGEFKKAMDEAVLRALEKCGLVAEGYAKKLAPVNTGRLRNSLTHTVKAKEQAAYIGTNVEYAAYVELGTQHQSAQPYLKPAVANHAKEYQKIVKDEMKSG